MGIEAQAELAVAALVVARIAVYVSIALMGLCAVCGALEMRQTNQAVERNGRSERRTR